METQQAHEGGCKFFRYDDNGRTILTASPAAVIGYDESDNDLLNYNSITEEFEYLKDTDGLINLTEYYISSESSSTPFPEGYPKNNKIQKGQQGTPILLQAWEYDDHTSGDDTVFQVSKLIQYPDDSTSSTTIETSYSYSYYTDTTQVKLKTTTLPVVATTQNGSGIANTRKEYFDEFGYLTWEMNERGFITNYSYDVVTGAMTQQIDDVDTSLTSDEPAG